jgi:hypothetical protein
MLAANHKNFAKAYLVENKMVIHSIAEKGEIVGGIKITGYSHGVIENKHRGNGRLGNSHDIYENKEVIFFEATMFMKIRGVTRFWLGAAKGSRG